MEDALARPVSSTQQQQQETLLLALLAADGIAGGGPQTSLPSLPSWLQPAAFVAPDFDADAAVAELRRHAPLPTLSAHLQYLLAALKARLVEVINEDYSAYVGVTARLAGVDGAVLRMRKPLAELVDRLGVVADGLRSELAALAAGLKRRKEAGAARALLELLQNGSHLAAKVDKLLGEADGDDPRLLERAAGEVSRLYDLVAPSGPGAQCAYVRAELAPRADAARRALLAMLGASLSAALQSDAGADAAAVSPCLAAYAELGAPDPPETALRALIVQPALAKVFGGSSGGGAAKPQRLAHLLEAVETTVIPGLGGLLTSAPAALDLPGNVLLAELDAGLASSAPGLFSPGVPSAFHANFMAAAGFLTRLETMAASGGRGAAGVRRFRASAAYASFTRRWNLPAYFSLIYQDIAGEVEDAAAGVGGVPAVGAAVVRGLTRLSDPSVFLPPLADRFLKLALQLAARYVSWADNVAAGGQLEAALSAYTDAATVVAPHLRAEFTPRFLGLLAAGDGSEVSQAVAAGLSAAADDVELSCARDRLLLGVAAPSLASRCTGELGGALKGLGAMARMATHKRGPPDRPSHYVSGLLAPLRERLPCEGAAVLVPAVLDAVAARYASLAEDSLDTVRKTESSLKKLKKAGGTGPGAGPGEEGGAADRLAAQLALDVREFERGAQALLPPGVPLPASFARLAALQ